MKRISLIKRFAACSICAVICLSLMSGTQYGVNSQNASAISSEAQENENNISQAQQQISELMQAQLALDAQIKATEGNIKKEEENQKVISKQIETVQKTILTLESSIKDLNEQISKLQTEIEESEISIHTKKQEIDTGTEDFKRRLRALYIIGDSSYASLVAGSSDFYDMLMKMELGEESIQLNTEIKMKVLVHRKAM